MKGRAKLQIEHVFEYVLCRCLNIQTVHDGKEEHSIQLQV